MPGGIAGTALTGVGRVVGRAALRAGLLSLLVACTAAPPRPVPSATGPEPAAATQPGATPAPTRPDWRTDPDEPFPFRTPSPPFAPTAVDGVYTRAPTDRYEGERIPCRRCPPYPLDAGPSILTLDRGRYRMEHVAPPYRSLGHFEVDGETLILWNDIECTGTRGVYRWRIAGDRLVLEAIDDACAFGQRADDLTAMAWRRVATARRPECDPPNEEAAISGHWPAPSGC